MARVADAQLRRIERGAILACAVMAAGAFVLSGGASGPAVAVLAGGLLIGISYLTIGAGVTAFVDLAAAPRQGADAPSGARPSVLKTVVKVGVRYALLALLAYVMIARLRLHPLGLLAGASSVVAAAAVEAFRLLK
jgi:hypothetical protein